MDSANTRTAFHPHHHDQQDDGTENRTQLTSECPSDIPLSGENVDRDDCDGIIKITIMEEGHLRLVDASGHVYFLSSDELRQRNIDVNALTDDNIHEIIQLAMPQLLTDGKPTTTNGSGSSAIRSSVDSANSPKRRRLAGGEAFGDGKEMVVDSYYSSPPTSHHGYQPAPQHSQSPSIQPADHGYRGGRYSGGAYHSISHHQPSHHQHSIPQSQHPTTASTSAGLQSSKQMTSSNFRATSAGTSQSAAESSSSRELTDGTGGLSGRVMIGEEMEVKNAEGRVEMAIVRYYRPGTGYKIQFADGHFEWLEEHSVLAVKQDAGQAFNSGKPTPGSGVKVPQRIPMVVGGGSTQFRRVGPAAITSAAANSYHHHGGIAASTSTAAADVVDENGSHHHHSVNGRKSPHGPVTNRPIQYRPMATRQRHQSQHGMYRESAMPPPNIMGMRVTLSEDAYNHPSQHGYGRHDTQSSHATVGYGPSTAQNLDDEELLAEPPYHQHAEYVPDGGLYGPPPPENFYCAVCDRSCPHDNISVIVVRIPACVDCAGSKVIIVDDEFDQTPEAIPSSKGETLGQDRRPTFRGGSSVNGSPSAQNIDGLTDDPTTVKREHIVRSSTPHQHHVGNSPALEPVKQNLLAVDGYRDLLDENRHIIGNESGPIHSLDGGGPAVAAVELSAGDGVALIADDYAESRRHNSDSHSQHDDLRSEEA